MLLWKVARMNPFSCELLRSIKVFICLTLIVIVLPSSAEWMIDDVINDDCASPSKYFLKREDVLNYCSIRELKGAEFSDPRSILCTGLLDLHMKFCPKYRSLPSEALYNLTEKFYGEAKFQSVSLDDLCQKIDTSSRSGDKFSGLFQTPSFKIIAKGCKDVCKRFGESKDRPNVMCPILYCGALVLSKKNGADGDPATQKGLLDMEKLKVNSPSNLKEENVAPKSMKGVEEDPMNLEQEEKQPSVAEQPNIVKNTKVNEEPYLPVKGSESNTNSSSSSVSQVPIDNSKLSSSPSQDQVASSPNSNVGKPVNSYSSNSEKIAQPLDNQEGPQLLDDDDTVSGGFRNFHPSESLKSGDSGNLKNPPLPESAEIDNGLQSEKNSQFKDSPIIEKSESTPKMIVQAENEGKQDVGGSRDKKPAIVSENLPADDSLKAVNAPDDPSVNIDGPPPKTNEDFLEDGDGDGNILNEAEFKSAHQDFSPFVEAEDSHFFQYFMIISAAFIIGYVVLVNKKKLIALIVEGRRDGSRRRHHSASYSKLDSNLEEALSSNRTAVSSHQVLY